MMAPPERLSIADDSVRVRGGGGQGETRWHLLSDYQRADDSVRVRGGGGQGET